MNEACRRNQLVRGIAFEVDLSKREADVEVNGPHVQSAKGRTDFLIVQVELNTTKLYELCDFPKDDVRNPPRRTGKQAFLTACQRAGQRVQNDMGIKIQHAT